MKRELSMAAAVAILLASCGGNETPKEPVVVEETVVVTDTVKVIETVDTAAIIAHYEALHAAHPKKVATGHKTHKVKKDKTVAVMSHPVVEHHDVIQNPPPAPAPANSPDPVVIVLHDKETVYFRPDEKASFPGGEKAFDKFLLENLEYPEEALDANVEGTVHAVVSLDEQGNVSKVEFPDGRLGFGLNREAERILKSSPRWNPAKHAGVPVKSKFGIPITFDIK